MPTFKPKKPTKDKMQFEVDLEKIFGMKVASRSLKETIGQAIIDTLVDRTQSKKSLTGGKFKPYKEEYAKKKKVSVNDVDLKLTEDMHQSIDVLVNKSQKIVIAVDEEEAPKAYNHHVGDTLPKREWFGIQQKEINKLVSEFRPRVKAGQKAERKVSREEEDIQTIINQLSTGLFDFG